MPYYRYEPYIKASPSCLQRAIATIAAVEARVPGTRHVHERLQAISATTGSVAAVAVAVGAGAGAVEGEGGATTGCTVRRHCHCHCEAGRQAGSCS
jgi:hypothetical protein